MHQLLIVPQPDPMQPCRSLSVLTHHPYRRFITARLDLTLDIIRDIRRFLQRTCPVQRPQPAYLVERTVGDVTFQLECIQDFLAVAPASNTPQSEPPIRTPMPGTPPMTGWWNSLQPVGCESLHLSAIYITAIGFFTFECNLHWMQVFTDLPNFLSADGMCDFSLCSNWLQLVADDVFICGGIPYEWIGQLGQTNLRQMKLPTLKTCQCLQLDVLEFVFEEFHLGCLWFGYLILYF